MAFALEPERAMPKSTTQTCTTVDVSSVAANKAGILADRDRRAMTVAHVPFYYGIHLNEQCNQKCIMCLPHGSTGRDFIPYDRFVALFEQIRPHAEHLTLIGGEPLMYPHIVEVLDLLAQHPIGVTINTNATTLTDRVVPHLLRLHRLELKCSFDAATESTYLRVRGKDHFRRAITHLLGFAEAAQGLPHIDIIPVFVVMRENVNEVIDFLDVAELLDPARVEFHPVRNVVHWSVDNGTGWHFEGAEQVCESFADEFDAVMQHAELVAADKGIEVEVHYL